MSQTLGFECLFREVVVDAVKAQLRQARELTEAARREGHEGVCCEIVSVLLLRTLQIQGWLQFQLPMLQ